MVPLCVYEAGINGSSLRLRQESMVPLCVYEVGINVFSLPPQNGTHGSSDADEITHV